MKNIKMGTRKELEYLEGLIELTNDDLKELTAYKARLMKRCEELRKELQNDEGNTEKNSTTI